MSDGNEIRRTGWVAITVGDATGLRDFHEQEVGWKSETASMGDYRDYAMAAPGANELVTGICHAHNGNADLGVGWLIYITVEDNLASVAACTANGGKIVEAPRELSGGQFCVIEDPGGAAALSQP